MAMTTVVGLHGTTVSRDVRGTLSGRETCTYCKREHSDWEPCWDFSTPESRNGLTWEQIIKSLPSFSGKVTCIHCKHEHSTWEHCWNFQKQVEHEEELLQHDAITPREIHPDSAPSMVIPEEVVIQE